MTKENLVSSLSSIDSSASVTILSLPNELLDEIFRHAHRGRATPAPICRALYPFQQKHLYREICVDSFDRLAEVWDALKANKRLASLVERLTISMADYAAAGVATRSVARDMFIWAILNLQHLRRLRLEHVDSEVIEICHQIVRHLPSHGPSRRLLLEAVVSPDDLALSLTSATDEFWPDAWPFALQIRDSGRFRSLKRLELGGAACAHAGSALFMFLNSLPALEHLVFLAGSTVTDYLLPGILDLAARHHTLRRLTLDHGRPERYGAAWADVGFVWREDARFEPFHLLPGWLGPVWPKDCSSHGQRAALERAPPGLRIDGEVPARLDAPPRDASWHEAFFEETKWGTFLFCRHEDDFTELRKYLGEQQASDFVREVDIETWRKEFGERAAEGPSPS
ncbi:hypothetical protein Rhopal_006682-T1 [Rhodotorula paludigena]|uniref:F-box domain-containing protein n=1 Tax=Rhodotorula paludigena TaxID=86838 RepID=A0AAV5GUN9_9BASI|nr:hypothetical protein Rhopal_006682-T1 [Rhodotorula paludigena]